MHYCILISSAKAYETCFTVIWKWNTFRSCCMMTYVHGLKWRGVFREVMLKILAEDRFCGRVIGKEGMVIKKIREDTDTKIIVSKWDFLEEYHIGLLKVLLVRSLMVVSIIYFQTCLFYRFCGTSQAFFLLRFSTVLFFFFFSAQEVASLFPDRIITVRGSVEGLSKAEEAISKILRESFDKEADQGMVRTSKSFLKWLWFQSFTFFTTLRNP